MATAPKYTEINRLGNSRQSRGGRPPRLFLLHTQEGNGTAESLAKYCNNPANRVSYHYTARDGIVADVVDTDYASWSVGDANAYTINYCFAGSFAGWSRAQWLEREDDIAIAAWFAVQDAAKYRFTPDWLGSGGDYRPANQGVSDHQYVTDVIGWGTHEDVGPGFPGDVFENYLEIYSGAAGEDDGMSDVWTDPVTKPDGGTEQAGILLGWNNQQIGDVLDQLAGPGTKNQRGGIKPTGWPQLGQNPDGSNRSLVDGVAAVLTELAVMSAGQAAVRARLDAIEKALGKGQDA